MDAASVVCILGRLSFRTAPQRVEDALWRRSGISSILRKIPGSPLSRRPGMTVRELGCFGGSASLAMTE